MAPMPGGTSPTLEQRTVVRSGLGHEYVRVQFPHEQSFAPRGQGVLQATERVLAPRSVAGRAYQGLKRVVIGNRLATQMQVHERLTKVKALAVLSSDAISSVAYATEASLGILILAGAAALHYNPYIAGAIALLMVIVGTSYWQTIHAYPHGGGSYIVARDNLGDWPGLIAAAALLIDYVLTVSVSVSSGVDYLLSAFPRLAGLDVVLGVACIAIILLVNLRGIRESGTIFTAPTYFFIGAFLFMIVVGVVRAVLGPGGLLGAVPPAKTPEELGWVSPGSSLATLGPLLIMTAFASGCSAMTGTEAISNGVPAFKPPEAHNAARTLAWMVAILVTLYLGVTYLAWRFGIEPVPTQQPTVNDQIAQLLFGGPFIWIRYVIDVATLLILVLAANTSFADFPRLSSILARDAYLPHQFAFRGDRLAFTVGIVVLGVLSSVLLVIFHGSTDALINLYALGVFVAFTLSQTGMVVRWWRRREAAGRGWRRSLVINLIGAIATGLVAIIIAVSKFDRGAWIVVFLVPLLVLLFFLIHLHYTRVERLVKQLARQNETLTPLRSEDVRHLMIVPFANLNPPALQAIAYARSITPWVIAVHVATDPEEEQAVQQAWTDWSRGRQAQWERDATAWAALAAVRGDRAGREVPTVYRNGPQLVVIESPYRALVPPLVAYIDAVRDSHPGATVTVVLPEFVPAHWWDNLLHNQTALRLKLALYSHPGVVVVNVPYHLKTRSGPLEPPATPMEATPPR
jgi:amino acid transporter